MPSRTAGALHAFALAAVLAAAVRGAQARAVVRREGRAQTLASGGDEPASSDEDGDKDKPVTPRGTGVFNHKENSPMCNGCGDTYYTLDEEKNAWALVLKLSGQDMCFESKKWFDMMGLNSGKMMNETFPKLGAEDGKTVAFHRLKDVKELKFTNGERKSVTVTFESKASPQELMTSNAVGFLAYPDWNKWKEVFAPGLKGYDWAPAFMRNGQPATRPAPKCRVGSNLKPQGCAAACMFCFYVGAGHEGCPETSNGTDNVTIGIGLSAEGCEVAGSSCSAYPYVGFKHPFGEFDETTDETKSIQVWAKVDFSDLESYEADKNVDPTLESGTAEKQAAAAVPPAVPPSAGQSMPDMGSIPQEDGIFEHTKFHKLCPGCGKVLYKMEGKHAMALVLKLAGGDFCYGDERWHDGMAYGPEEEMHNASFPGNTDHKSLAFHQLQGATEVIIATARGGESVIKFDKGGTPEELFTSTKHKLREYPEWGTWNGAFSSKAAVAPMLMRAGVPVSEPLSPCRKEENQLGGCGLPCMLCFQANMRLAEEGAGCPARAFGNDYAVGIGLSPQSPACCGTHKSEASAGATAPAAVPDVADAAEKSAEAKMEEAVKSSDPGAEPLAASTEDERSELENVACKDWTPSFDAKTCSAGSFNSGPNSVVVWAKVTKPYLDVLMLR